MDYHLKGHPYVKAGIDTACWDILGKVCLGPTHDVTDAPVKGLLHCKKMLANSNPPPGCH
jgi:hypothetical protein